MISTVGIHEDSGWDKSVLECQIGRMDLLENILEHILKNILKLKIFLNCGPYWLALRVMKMEETDQIFTFMTLSMRGLSLLKKQLANECIGMGVRGRYIARAAFCMCYTQALVCGTVCDIIFLMTL